MCYSNYSILSPSNGRRDFLVILLLEQRTKNVILIELAIGKIETRVSISSVVSMQCELFTTRVYADFITLSQIDSFERDFFVL